MRYAGIIENDVVNGEGVSVSFWTQGCPHHCKGCHNPETWSFDGGKEDSLANIYDKIIKALKANNVKRNFSILGGEPLCADNIEEVFCITERVKEVLPDTKIFLWTGYELNELKNSYGEDLHFILQYIDVLITGRYKEELRDITQKWKGSSNQKVLYKGIDF